MPSSSHPRRRWRTLVAGAAAAVALVLAGCGDAGRRDTAPADGAATASDKPRLAIVYYPQFRDGSWGEAALTGAQKLKDAGVIADFAVQENVDPGADGVRALRSFAEQGYNPIIAHSFNYGDDVKQVAPEFPNTIFAYAGGFGDVQDNVADYSQPFWEATYLEGILAAGVTEGGGVAGAGGFDIPVCRAMYNAYLEGAKLVRPETTGSFVAVGDWSDVQMAKEAALAQADQGATMFVGCGQGPTFGQIEAATERGAVAVGYTGDMSGLSEQVLASFTWNLDKVFEEMVADVVAGRTNPTRYYEVGMTKDGMDVVINPVWRDRIPAEVMALYEQKLEEIRSGAFTVAMNTQ
ncbi:MAG TPA: BMP family protein [Pseudonocardia sp.]|jgi:basic membrane lipoprotein Med (substrate-binding protein (PBP1-ABC) superfamily)|uniref:BMP family protein n=1 Tax=Pseudonocardia sp. TaxID=60912 RepID=UPI002B4B184A|nr:BMP family protein [Pseudonocardia sp.]HLU55150.1 BMP family protein [Pseudonocardia sp.]